MSKHSGKIGLYLLLIVALIAGYLYLNDQVSTQGSYTMGQLEKALEEDKVTDAVIHQNREVPTGYVTTNIVSDGQRTVYVTDVKEAEELLEKYDIDPTIRNVPKDSSMIGTVLPVVLTGAILIFFFMMMNRQMSGGGGSNAKMMNFGKSRARMSTPDDKKVTFKDVAGLQEEKEDLEEVVDFLKSPQKYTKVGALRTSPRNPILKWRKTEHRLLLQLPSQEGFYQFPEGPQGSLPSGSSRPHPYISSDSLRNQRSLRVLPSPPQDLRPLRSSRNLSGSSSRGSFQNSSSSHCFRRLRTSAGSSS